jgi:hypothetical protein
MGARVKVGRGSTGARVVGLPTCLPQERAKSQPSGQRAPSAVRSGSPRLVTAMSPQTLARCPPRPCWVPGTRGSSYPQSSHCPRQPHQSPVVVQNQGSGPPGG